MIVHAVTESRWRRFEESDAYCHPSLESEGFIHFSDPDQVVDVADAREWPDGEALLLLCVDPDELDPPVEYEGEPTAHPHVYGPIPEEAIVDVLPFPRDDGGFRLPDELQSLAGR